MKKSLFGQIITTSLLIALSANINVSFAAKKHRSSIRIKQYLEATCDDYRGTWEGFASDPSNLFKDGGPWPIMVHLYSKDGYVIGRSTKVSDVFKEKPVWARCKNGRLSNIFWGEKGNCGRYTQKGLLVSKNVLILELGHQNAMNDADILLLLTRKSNTYPYSAPKDKKDYQLGQVKTCH